MYALQIIKTRLVWCILFFSLGGCNSATQSTFVQSTSVQLSAPIFSRADESLPITPLFGDFSFTKRWQARWGAAWVKRAETARVFIEQDLSGLPSVGVTYPQSAVGPSQGGLQFPASFAAMSDLSPTAFNELHLRYRVFFEPGFDFVKGGKLPGLMGGGESWTRSGGNQPNGENGWTMRFMWRNQGEVVVYSYLPPSTNGQYGNHIWGVDIPLSRRFTTGKWHTIEQRIKLNDLGQENGELTVWFDDEQVLSLNDITYRTKDNVNGKIGGVYFSTFHGGNDASWAPDTLSKARFSDFAISSGRIGNK
jgi:hypothetical protein